MSPVLDFKFGGLANALDEVRTPDDKAFGGQNCFVDRGVLEVGPRYDQIGSRLTPNAADIGWGMGYGKITVDERQKFAVTGGIATSGAAQFTFTHNAVTYSSASDVDFNATADAFYQYLQTLANGGNFAFKANEIQVTGGPWPAIPFKVTFKGRYRATDIAMLVCSSETLAGTSSPTATVTEEVKGGDHEVIYSVVQHSGDTDSNLYAITSSDGFLTTTWTSLATTMDSSPWEIKQYADKMMMVNQNDGLRYLYIGSSVISPTPPAAPTRAPTFGQPLTDEVEINLGTGCSWVAGSFTNAPTLSAQNAAVKCVLTGREVGTRTITVTLATDEDLSTNDWGSIQFASWQTAIDPDSFKVEFINADGTPVTIKPPVVSQGFSSNGGKNVTTRIQLAGEVRYSRDNIDKIKFTFNMLDGASGHEFFIFMGMGSNWMNDTLDLELVFDGTPTKDENEYVMSYYDVVNDVESALSPIGTSPTLPRTFLGNYIGVNGYGSTELASTDLQWFYRREKATGKWRRIPNVWTKETYQLTDYGVANDPTGASDGQYDHWMEYELANFPEPMSLGFPPIGTGVKAEVIAIWKQCLAIGADRQLWISSRGRPFDFAPSPDDTEELPDPDDESRPSTEYVSDNRAEEVMGIVAGDSMYVTSEETSYTKIGDLPSDATVPRKLPGSRGTLGRRSTAALGGGVMLLSQDGWWFYSVGRGVSGEDNGNLTERELTQGVRKSYEDLFNAVQSILCQAPSGSFVLTVLGQKLTVQFDATAEDIEDGILNLTGVEYGDVECWGGPLTHDKVFVRFRNRYQGQAVTLMTANTENLADPDRLVIEEVCAGGQIEPICIEHDNQLWAFNGNRFLTNTREQTWLEGTFGDKVAAVLSIRSLGLLFLSATGKLMRIASKHRTDNGELVTWRYHTGIIGGQRSKVTQIEIDGKGTPTIQITMWDGLNRRTTRTYTRQSGARWVIPLNENPGYRMRLRFVGIGGRDTIDECKVTMEPTISKGTRL